MRAPWEQRADSASQARLGLPVMGKRTVEVDVRRERSGYWAQVRELEGCFASGDTLDELIDALREAIALYIGDEQPERLLIRLTGLQLELEPELRPAQADQLNRPPGRRRRRSHPDDTASDAGA